MATFSGDVQYSQVMGHLPTPVSQAQPRPSSKHCIAAAGTPAAQWRDGGGRVHEGGGSEGIKVSQIALL